jgi:hypothetical protein
MLYLLRYLAAAALSVVVFGTVQARATEVTLFDTITGQSWFNGDALSELPGASFSTGGSAATLTEVDFGVVYDVPDPLVEADLYSSDDSGVPPNPGAFITTLGTFYVPSATVDSTGMIFTSSPV